MKKVDVIVDLQYGSTGKGLLAGYLSESGKYDTVVSANMPNAGHTTVLADGRSWVNKAMPNGVMVSSRIMMGPGSVFNPAQLAKEVKHLESMGLLDGKSIIIHEAAGILKPEHAEAERNNLSRISSTMQGSAEALISKIRREQGAIARDNSIVIYDALDEVGADTADVMVVNQQEWLAHLSQSDRILVEGSQGYSLGISSGFYPYCTSRECTASRVLADCNIPAKWLDKVYGVARVHPIRVGNTADGYSGDIYDDQKELSWEELGLDPEYTTVTKRVRRVFSFSHKQFYEAVLANECDEVFLNFANYDTKAALGIIKRSEEYFDRKLITMVGLGARNDQIRPVRPFVEAVSEQLDEQEEKARQ
ncbi:2-aminooxy adenylosuccinate synthetase [Burkholderia phage Bm1]